MIARSISAYLPAVTLFLSIGLVPAVLQAGGDDADVQRRMGNPFAYCESVGSIDAPDGRYSGPKVPNGIVAGLRRALGTPSDAPDDWIRQGTTWRCMDGQVYACFVGANLPCDEKADVSRSPSAAMTDYCKSNPGSDAIPAAVTGRATVFSWRCRDASPEIVKQVDQADARGFLSNVWHRIAPGG